MNWLQRLKNLWYLSEMEPSNNVLVHKSSSVGITSFPLKEKKRLATIMEPDSDFLQDVPIVK